MSEAIGERGIRARLSPPMGSVNCAAQPHLIRADAPFRYVRRVMTVSH